LTLYPGDCVHFGMLTEIGFILLYIYLSIYQIKYSV